MIKILILIPILFLIILQTQYAVAQLQECPFGATIELDQKVYTWTDKVYITIVSPCHNFDTEQPDEIGDEFHPIQIATRNFVLELYELRETGNDTAIFTGEVILTGNPTHDADGDGNANDATGIHGGLGPDNGFLPADSNDGITISFEFIEDETVVGSALIRWNIGEVQWIEPYHLPSGTGIVRIVDPDMNLNPELVDSFGIDVWSDSDNGGIDLTVTETNEATGIFEGTVLFTTTDESSGSRLRVAEGDTVTAEYEDNTLPDPYTTADQLDITATSIIVDNMWTLEQIQGSSLELENNDATIVFPENVDAYFPYNRELKQKIENLVAQGLFDARRFQETSNVVYVNNDLIATKTSVVTISDYQEYLSIFGNDRTNPIQLQDKFGNTINENTITSQIQSKLAACGQNTIQYCGKTLEELKRMVLEKTGTHTITENLVIMQIKGESERDLNDSTPFQLTSSQSSFSATDTEKFVLGNLQDNMIPNAEAQSAGPFHQIDVGKYDLNFLNGFTVGFGYERNWSYQFNVAGLVPVSIDAHVENGLGMGLRIPINLLLEIDASEESPNSGQVKYDVKHKVRTKNITISEYEEFGLAEHQLFAGKEFKMYLGPSIDVLIKVFDTVVIDESERLGPVETLESYNFTPPLGSMNNEVPITKFTLSCKITKTCFERNAVTIGLSAGGEGRLAGGEITLDSKLLNPRTTNHELSFKHPNDSKNYIETFSIQNPTEPPYTFQINNIAYHSNLHIIPQIILNASFNSWIFPLSYSEEIVNLPRIEFNGITLENHEGVEGQITQSGKVPEFGVIAGLVLALAILSVIVISVKSRLIISR